MHKHMNKNTYVQWCSGKLTRTQEMYRKILTMKYNQWEYFIKTKCINTYTRKLWTNM